MFNRSITKKWIIFTKLVLLNISSDETIKILRDCSTILIKKCIIFAKLVPWNISSDETIKKVFFEDPPTKKVIFAKLY